MTHAEYLRSQCEQFLKEHTAGGLTPVVGQNPSRSHGSELHVAMFAFGGGLLAIDSDVDDARAEREAKEASEERKPDHE